MVGVQELGPGDIRDSEGRPSKAEFPPAQVYQWVSQEPVAEFFERSIKSELRVVQQKGSVEGNVASSAPKRTARFLTSFRPGSYLHRPQWKRCGLGVRGWRCCEGVVARRYIGERRFHPRVNPDVGVKLPVNRTLAFRKVGRFIFW